MSNLGANGIDSDLSAVAGGNVNAVAVLDHSGSQSVERHLGSLIAGESLGQSDAHAIGQAGIESQLGGSDLPVSAGHALEVSLVAERDEQHLGELIAGELTIGIELAVADTGNDALRGAVGDVALSPAAHVGEVGLEIQTVSGSLTEQHDADDLCGLSAGEVGIGIKLAVFIADENADSVHNFNSFLIVNVLGIDKVRCVADGDEGHGHDQRQHQSE